MIIQISPLKTQVYRPSAETNGWFPAAVGSWMASRVLPRMILSACAIAVLSGPRWVWASLSRLLSPSPVRP